jgi:hypothetical protein
MKTRLKILLGLLTLVIIIGVSIFFIKKEREKKIIEENTKVIDLSVVEKSQKVQEAEKRKKENEKALEKAKENQYHLSGVEAKIFESTVESKIKADNELFKIQALKRGEGEPMSPWKNLNRVKIRGKVVANPQKNFYTLLTENNEQINFLVSTIADQKDKTYAYHATCEEKDGSYCKACLTSFYLRNSVNLDTNIKYEKKEVRALNKGEMVSIIVKSIPMEEVDAPEDYLEVGEEDDTVFFKVILDPSIDKIANESDWQRLNFVRNINGEITDSRKEKIYNIVGIIIYEK